MPRVSVIISTYNRAGLVVEAIDSVLKQRFQDYEIIVVDNGSTDDTAERLAAFGGRIRYLKLDDRGWNTVVYRNPGIALAQGEFIAFLDDDDTWRPDKLDRQVALLDRDESAGFAYSDLHFLHPDGSISGPVLPAHHKRGGAVFDQLLTECFICCSTLMVRRRLLDQIGLFDEKLAGCEDYDLLLRLAYATRAGCVAEPLVFRRLHAVGASARLGIRNYQNSIFILERFLRRTPLSLRRRLQARKTLSRWYAHIGLVLSSSGDLPGARPYFVHSLQWNPLQRRGWVAFAQSYGLRSL